MSFDEWLDGYARAWRERDSEAVARQRTLVGILYLLFDDNGLCRELREAWIEEPGRREPYDGWGR